MNNDRTFAKAIRFLCVDAIQRANSGHPGTPMGMADIAAVLWGNYLNHNPSDPNWINRDRFVLSNGHGSMLLYSLLHLTGYDLSIEEIKKFRQFQSQTPGHPEYGSTVGVETTTGPLGQGLANAIGFAVAEKILSKKFNKPKYPIIDHYTYVFVGDGCVMEGVSHEVCSLAGTWKLGKLIVFYDSNGISIDGKIETWFTDDTALRFSSYKWHVIDDIDGHDVSKIKLAINEAKSVRDRPSLIICKTIIGYGSPVKSGSEKIHGSPIGKKSIVEMRKRFNWKYKEFEIPKDLYRSFSARKKGKKIQKKWFKMFSSYQKKFPTLFRELTRRMKKQLPERWKEKMNSFVQFLQKNPSDVSGRQASKNTLEILYEVLPELLGGSADLTPSNLSKATTSKSIDHHFSGNYIHYGAREFGMSAIINGISIYGGFIPYGATFLTFVEYARNAVRMAALMKVRSIFVYTHDSIGVGEDGPTHQPIEQLTHLRTTPNISVWRPCDQVESAVSWRLAVERKDGPSALIFSRQTLFQESRDNEQIAEISKGGYILKKNSDSPELILIATGSEVRLAVESYHILVKEGYTVRVVSMPSSDVFDRQKFSYQKKVISSDSTHYKIAIEAGSTDFWYRYIGGNGIVIGINSFGYSASGDILFENMGLTVSNIVKKAKKLFNMSDNERIRMRRTDF
ncbi:transketolase [Candidatus Riesia pediculischaeffi]|uniref:Transketolase n=2 Tax=Candidatus Riesia pediculischaeffi TaxID=428411 RepID=A0A1V0HKL5_9ENTR|nr:transketolase [Candidatus Riesia pediculischaeffi]ARC53364.1 transketolase [Candidatus Riesia pediculischaeffi]KIE63852.1 Transketolase [Candidatus Riesia pediculischaeffi PTSU]